MATTYSSEYVFGGALTQELKDEIQRRTQEKLTEMLGVEVDTVMAEYVVVMIGNKKSMEQITHDLVDFIGDEHAQAFVVWLSGVLPTLDDSTTSTSGEGHANDDEDLAPPVDGAQAQEPPQSGKRVISLKGPSSAPVQPAATKKVISLSGGGGGGSGTTIRTLNSTGDDLRDMLARRSQRFGVTTTSQPQPRTKATTGQDKNKDQLDTSRGSKRKAEASDAQQKRPNSATGSSSSGRLTQLLGPPVNVDQAELDARDSLNSNKRKKTGLGGDDRDSRGGGNKYEQENEKNADGDNNGRRQNRRRQDNNDKDGDRPPLPPSSPRDGDRDRHPRSDRTGGGRNDRDGRDQRDARGPPHQGGNFRNGPPGFGGGFPPPPFGHHPMYFPPPFGMGMPPYGMGFPPQGMHPHQGPPYMAPPMPPGPLKPQFQPRGAPRPFQNKTWVNPNAPKTDADAAPTGDAATSEGASTGGAGTAALNSKATSYMPRNPYFQQSQMRPRFQNKTWVRQDPAKEEEFSASLPLTPPPQGDTQNETAME